MLEFLIDPFEPNLPTATTNVKWVENFRTCVKVVSVGADKNYSRCKLIKFSLVNKSFSRVDSIKDVSRIVAKLVNCWSINRVHFDATNLHLLNFLHELTFSLRSVLVGLKLFLHKMYLVTNLTHTRCTLIDSLRLSVTEDFALEPATALVQTKHSPFVCEHRN